MANLSNALSRFFSRTGTAHTFHIFIASSAGQIVKSMVPSGLRQLWPTAPECARTLTMRRYEGYVCTVIELASGETAATGRPFAIGLSGCHDVPCVLNSSLQWGDQCNEVMAVLNEMTFCGTGIEDVDFTLKIRILPSGKTEPVASRSGCQGHHANACERIRMRSSDSRALPGTHLYCCVMQHPPP